MVRVVLDIQPDERLRNTINDSQRKASLGRDPQILQIKEETDVAECTEKVTWSTELTSTAYNLEDFLFDFTLERCVKQVSIASTLDDDDLDDWWKDKTMRGTYSFR